MLPGEVLTFHEGGQTHSAFLLPDRRFYLVSHYGFEVRFDPENAEATLHEEQLDMEFCSAMDLSSDGAIAALGGEEIMIREPDTLKIRKSWKIDSMMWGLSLSTNRKYLLFSREPNIFELYSMLNYSKLDSLRLADRCAAVSFINDTEEFILLSSGQRASVLYRGSASNFEHTEETGLFVYSDGAADVEISPSGRLVAFSDRVLRIGTLEGPPTIQTIEEPRGPSERLPDVILHTWSRPIWLNDERLAVNPPGDEAFVFDVKTGEVVAQLETTDQVDCFAFDHARGLLYGALCGGDVVRWDVNGVL